MKFLQAAVLSAVCVGYVTASHLDYDRYLVLYDAINKGGLDIAVELVKQDEALVEVGLSWLISKDNRDPDLIANFVNQTNQANARTLDKLWHGRSRETFEEVLEKVAFPQQVLVDVASSYYMASMTDKFLVVLSKIITSEDQEKAVEKGVEGLVCWAADTSPLLSALKGKTFRSERLEYFAIQKAFIEGVKRSKEDHLPKDIFRHAAITPELYADALIVTAAWEKYVTRLFLLKQADCYDLQAVKEKAGYARLRPKFHDDIEEALKIAKPGGTRTQDIERMEKAEETFEELESPRVPPEVVDLISAYVLADTQTPRRKAKIAAKKAVKRAASDATSTSTAKTESSRIRKRKRSKGKGRKWTDKS